MASKPEFVGGVAIPIFDANDEIGQISNLLDIFLVSGSPEMREFLDSLAGQQSDDKIKNKLRSFQLNTMEALIEMIQQIKNDKLHMSNAR